MQYIYKRFLRNVPAPARVLVIGVKGGRDYFLFRNLGHDVVALDLGPQPCIEPIVYCNVEEPLPFPAETFDLVLVGEVLEHLKEDARALEHIRHVLKPNGRLIVSLPFFHDAEEGHMRVHSPISGERLLKMAGFHVEDYLERPGLIWLNSINFLQHGLSALAYLLIRKTAYRWLNSLAGELEWNLGHLAWLRPIRKMSGRFGGYYLCCKAQAYDYIALNKRLYTKDERD